jgi:hypothetical protein
MDETHRCGVIKDLCCATDARAPCTTSSRAGQTEAPKGKDRAPDLRLTRGPSLLASEQLPPLPTAGLPSQMKPSELEGRRVAARVGV